MLILALACTSAPYHATYPAQQNGGGSFGHVPAVCRRRGAVPTCSDRPQGLHRQMEVHDMPPTRSPQLALGNALHTSVKSMQMGRAPGAAGQVQCAAPQHACRHQCRRERSPRCQRHSRGDHHGLVRQEWVWRHGWLETFSNNPRCVTMAVEPHTAGYASLVAWLTAVSVIILMQDAAQGPATAAAMGGAEG